MPAYSKQEANITVAFSEIDKSPQERFDDNGFVAVRQLKCAFSDRLLLARQLRGNVQVSANLVTVVVGQRYPHDPRAIAKDISIKPFFEMTSTDSPTPTVADYASAILNVVYRIPDGIEEPDPDVPNLAEILVTQNLEPSAEFLTIPKANLFYDAGKTRKVDEVSPGKVQVLIDWVYRIHTSPVIPEGTFDLIGTVNDRAMFSSKFDKSFAAETLLYNPPVLDPQVNSDGDTVYTIIYRFTHKPIGWNNVIDPEAVGTVTVIPIFGDDGEVFRIHELGDFRTVIST